jgi:peptidoglycan/LPS O-acetylase OafA/YrhL
MRQHIPALTGIRFFAAFTVVIAHGLLAIATFRQEPALLFQLKSLSALGMSIFFVLSGFVIHYTYSASLPKPGGLNNFFVARLARLYPLFILMFVLEHAYLHLIAPDTIPPFGQDVRALRYYATMTQTWWYAIFNDASLVYQFGPTGQISWSISTEIAFYLAYPLLLPILSRLKQPRIVILAYVVHCVAAVGIIAALALNYESISEIGLRAFGEIADARMGTGQDSLFRWLLYFSPYSRILEFIAGALAAQLFITTTERPSAPEPSKLRGTLLSGLAVASVLATQIFLFAPKALPFDVPKYLFYLYMSFGFAPACGFLIYCCARYRNVFTAPFSWRPAIILGDASYSIYLLHMAFFTAFRLQPIDATPLNILIRLAMFCAVTALLFGTSLVTYRLIEVPARRWIRGALSLRDGQSATTWRWRRGAAIGIAVLALTVSIGTYFRDFRIGFQRWQLASNAIAGEIADGTIRVVDGRYGASCVQVKSNALDSLRRNCDGRLSCNYVVNVSILGDPAPGCSKDFRAEWRCSKDGDIRRLTVPPEAGFRSVAHLSCAP